MKKIYLQKAKKEIARPTKIRDINRQVVLNYVRARSPISRAEIARETELQRSTVSSIVESLKASNLIEEVGEGNSTGGRKPTLLRIKTGNPVVIGVDVTPRKTTVGVADLVGKVIEQESFATSADMNFMTDRIVKAVSRIAKKYSDIELEVGMSLPGIVDHEKGEVIYIPYFNWKNWKIVKSVQEATGLSVLIDNDANSVALAELWFGRAKIRKTENFITVLVAEGVGTGIIFEGQVYRGEKSMAGEFGHMVVGTKAPVECSCGSRKCWEAHASEKAIISRYKSLAENISSNDINIDQILDLAKNGEKNAVKVLHETTEFLGIGIANLIIGLSPQAIIVSGRITKVWDLISDKLTETATRSVRSRLPKTSLIPSSLEDPATLMGAISLVLVRKFASAT